MGYSIDQGHNVRGTCLHLALMLSALFKGPFCIELIGTQVHLSGKKACIHVHTYVLHDRADYYKCLGVHPFLS